MTTTTKTLTSEERKFYHCPAWCRRWDHDADLVSFEHPAMHYGPDSTHVWIQREGNGPIFANIYTDSCEQDHDAASLRHLAADALAAAEWLEARR